EGPTEPGGVELEWLPKLASRLPVEVPVPLAQGRPGANYPWFWEIHSWVEGEFVPVDEIDAVQAARDLAALVLALQRVDPTGAPPGRGIPLAVRDEQMRHWGGRFDGARGAEGARGGGIRRRREGGGSLARGAGGPPGGRPAGLAPRRPRLPQLAG